MPVVQMISDQLLKPEIVVFRVGREGDRTVHISDNCESKKQRYREQG